MKELNLSEMKPKDILRKEAFRRTLPSVSEIPYYANKDYETLMHNNRIKYCYVPQDSFLREYDPESHNINHIKFYPNLITTDTKAHRVRAKIRSRVAIAWQRRIHTKRVVALTGYDTSITLSNSQTGERYTELLKQFKEGWSIKNMDNAIHKAIAADLKVGDVAVCGYKDNGEFGTRIFSFDKGDILYPHLNPSNGRIDLFSRRFFVEIENSDGIVEQVEFLDVWDRKNYMQYRHITLAEESKDGKEWVVEIEPNPHGFPFCPVAYHRYGEPCWAASQSLIESNELSMSQLAENNAQYALRILYSLGADFEMQSSDDGTPKSITSTDPNSKIGFLEPADSSKSFELQITQQQKEIMRCSFAVETPEIKSGSDVSSLTVKMLFADSYQKALDDSKEYQSFIDDIVKIFKEGYGTEIAKVADFMGLHIQARLQPWVFQSETEVVNTLVQLASVGIISKKSASEAAYEMLGYGTIDEWDRILQEEHDKLVMESGTQTVSAQRVNVVANARNNQ